MKGQLNGGRLEPDKDHLITEDGDAVYRKCPGVHNVAYVVSSPGELLQLSGYVRSWKTWKSPGKKKKAQRFGKVMEMCSIHMCIHAEF